MTKDYNPAAFPTTSGEWTTNGMTLRDYFAGKALEGYRAARVSTGGAYPSECRLWSSREVARCAYDDAEAMLAERAKKEAK